MISRKNEQKILEIKVSGGVDITSDARDVAHSRASYMKNLVPDGAGSRKRHGVHQICAFRDKNDAPLKINGIHPYITDKGETVIIHAGCGFYRENGEKIPSSVEITDTPSSVFQLGGIMYIIGCGGLFVFDGESVKNAVPYIPVTYIGYDNIFDSDMELDGANMLSPMAIAHYFSQKLENTENAIFRFPKNISDDHEVTITASISNLTNQLYVCTGDAPDPDRDTKIDRPVTAVFKLSTKKMWHGRSKECETINIEGGSVYILDSLSTSEHIKTPKLQIHLNGGSFAFNFDTRASRFEDMLIRVDYRVRGWELSPAESCSIGAIIQDNRGESRLVLSGNPKHPNKIYFSDVIDGKDSVYFPEECAVSVDNDAPVTAFLKLSDSYLGVFKENRFFRYAFSHYPEAKSPKERHVISGFESRDAVGCINPRVCGRQGGDLLVFDGDGVFGIDNASAQTDKNFLAERSRNIRAGLRAHSREEKSGAVACMLDGKYYLFIGEKVYIADTYRDFSDKKLSSHRQYEWWICDGIPACCVGVINGKIYIGDTLGGISVIGEDYRDIRIHKAARSGDALYSEEDGLFTLNPSMIPSEPFFVRMPGECTFLEKGEFSAFIHTSFGKTRTVILPSVQTSRARTGDSLRLIKKSGEVICCYYLLYEDDSELGIFSLKDDTGELITVPPEEIDSIRIADDGTREYALKRFGNRFATYEGDEAVGWFGLPTPAPITAYTYAPVECVYASPLIDFGEPLRPKALFKIGIRAHTDAKGSLTFGYLTDKIKRAIDIKRGGFDIAELDLNSVSFALPFGRLLERRVFERRLFSSLFFCKSSDGIGLKISGIYAIYANGK